MRSRALAVASALLLAAACSAEPQAADDVCSRATAALETCAASSLDAPFGACEGSEAANAEAMLDQLDTFGCEGPPGGKADGFWCGFWDPFGWCDEPPAPLGPTPSGVPTRYPLLLAHGFNTSTTNFWRFNDLDAVLEKDGHVVALGSVPPFDRSETRATYLADQVDDLLTSTGAEKVNLICFSQGGVDCRYLVSPDGLDYADRVASVTLLSAPNRGTYLGDAAIALLPEAGSAKGRVVDLLASWYGRTFSELAADSHFVDAMESMSEAGMATFNDSVRDADGVLYQSWAGFSYVGGLPNPKDTLETVCRGDDGSPLILAHEGKRRRDFMDPLLAGGAALVAHGTELRPNDGVSTVESARWGWFRGCIPADHLDQVGQINDGGPDHRTGFDVQRFYRNMAYELASWGY